MLEVAAIHCRYGTVPVLGGLSLAVGAGQVLCLLGRNGAGKTTALKAIMGLVPIVAGQVTLAGEDITALPAERRARRGIGYVPQGRRLFADLTVAENLEIGTLAGGGDRRHRDRALALFPLLDSRLRQAAGTLSGGEQQMLAMARALALNPKVLLLDEPTEGLMPAMIARVREAVMALKGTGVATILVEQRAEAVLEIADSVTFIEHGLDRETVSPETVRSQPDLLRRYVGIEA